MGSVSSCSSSSGNNYIRRAHHAGSWYDGNLRDLNRTLDGFLGDASTGTEIGTNMGLPRAIISPHAGYAYSGPTAAFAYLALKEALLSNSQKKRDLTIVVLHPSHHVYLAGAAVSGASEIETPLGNIEVDDGLRKELLGSGKFSTMKQEVDEAEHSGELQYPYISKVIQDAADSSLVGKSVKVRALPIMIGAVSTAQEAEFGKVLAPYFCRPDIFVVVSSDFCHWGRRFDFSPHCSTSPDDGTPFNQIADYINWLDHKGMSHIEMQKPGAFAEYIRRTNITICGRHPISVWLNAVKFNRENNNEKVTVNFVKYDQSSTVKHLSESSVSYASAVARLLE